MRRVIAVVGLKMDNQLRVNDQLAGNSDHFSPARHSRLDYDLWMKTSSQRSFDTVIDGTADFVGASTDAIERVKFLEGNQFALEVIHVREVN